MNKELLSFIRTLSDADTKTLTQKALKTVEEVGELAKAVLPYENAAGTLHRFVNRRQILENAVDVILCGLSITHDLKYSDAEIEDMMVEKSKKWSGIQTKEGNAKFPLPFEIHITVDVSKVYQLDEIAIDKMITSFKNVCQELNVKPIILDLENNGSTIMNDVMTSSVHFGDNNSAQRAAHELAYNLKSDGYKVSRIKIETVPWHPAAPSIYDTNWIMPENSYFESHLRIVTSIERKPVLVKIAKELGAHLSRNFFKRINPDEYIIMMTIREDGESKESFQMIVDKAKTVLECEDFVVDKIEVEFAVFDSNVQHDQKWLEKLEEVN